MKKAREGGEIDKLLQNQKQKFDRERDELAEQVKQKERLIEAITADRALEEGLEKIKVKGGLRKAAFAFHRNKVKVISDCGRAARHPGRGRDRRRVHGRRRLSASLGRERRRRGRIPGEQPVDRRRRARRPRRPARAQAEAQDDSAREEPVHPGARQSRLRQVAMGPAEGLRSVTTQVDIAVERKVARANLEVAERAMKLMSADPEKFRAAKAEREAALEAIERLEWAEKHQEEVALKAKADHERRQLEDAQAGAQDAQERARTIVAQIVPLIEGLAVQVLELQRLSGLVNRGTHFEQYAVRERMIDRQTIVSGVGVDGQLAVRLLRVARELVKLSPVTMQVAEHRAIQGKLE